MNLILLGAPGAGKGTLASYLIEKMGVPSVSTGNILREAIANKTELGQKAKAFMDAGQLVPDQLVIDLLQGRIAQDDCKNGFILDGFPRTIPQAEALDQIASIDCALSLEVDDAVIEGRMTGRRVCLKCGATYHIKANPPKQEGVCDVCGDTLHIRKDDKPDVVKHRLATYHEQTEPLKDYYGAQGKLKSIDGAQGIEQTKILACQALGL
ncbi:adenylate kinase [Butyricicoccus pullicaecorum]|uniref:Adenylate kinase n=1 Tax=Butyricicoccus pullicaecorum 1.2 TaxID=1203606 RepID=R8VT90_9FIRM|nr:adenylate kinase [Butyricicoccus pullicaecorum]EOQ35709.1 adenylate kinase [Butyricicoccus pullicaecorum 1.2]SKA63395.1 Adenylate kinase [Butyricicoccus pullicaecorum DSM 23266]HJC20836.1 adenylate kinase [Candidatus Butyricicoccus avicola]